MTAYYSMLRLFQDRSSALEEVLKSAAATLVTGCQYPERVSARITLVNQSFTTESFTETPYRLGADLTVKGKTGRQNRDILPGKKGRIC